MKTSARVGRVFMAAVIGLVFLASAGSAAEPKYSGFLGDHYKDLQPGPKDGVKMRWSNPKVDFSKYNKYILDSVIFFFADDSEYKGIDAQDMKELADAFNLEAVNALKDKYPLVKEPGPDVLQIRVAITNVKQSKPIQGTISSVIPIGIGISLIKKGITGSYSGSGSTSMEFMALDSLTNEVIATAVDDRTAGYTERFSKWGSAKEAFKFWAQRLRIALDKSHETKPQ